MHVDHLAGAVKPGSDSITIAPCCGIGASRMMESLGPKDALPRRYRGDSMLIEVGRDTLHAQRMKEGREEKIFPQLHLMWVSKFNEMRG